MDKQFSGFIKWKGNLTTIVSKRDNKETIFREIIVSTDEQHPTSMLITFWGDLARQLEVAVPNQRISVDFDITAIEYVKDGKSFYKNNIKGWRFALGAVDVQPNWVVSSAYQSQQAVPQQAAAPLQQVAAPQLPPQQAPPQQVAAPQVATIPGYQLPPQQPAPAQQVAAPQQVAMQVNGLPNPVMLSQGQAPF